jgi:hypothetical protein
MAQANEEEKEFFCHRMRSRRSDSRPSLVHFGPSLARAGVYCCTFVTSLSIFFAVDGE